MTLEQRPRLITDALPDTAAVVLPVTLIRGGFIDNFDGSRGTKMQWLHHGIAQEMHHRGQLTLYARLMGLVPALTKRIGAG